MINLNDYIIAEETPEFNLSIKLVIPSGCGMNCPFCFNKLNANTAVLDKDGFMRNFIYSLETIIDAAGPKRSISLDITGNEPTHDIDLFKNVMKCLKNIKHKFNKIVLTSNGENLRAVAPDMNGVVDFVNISVHHYDFEGRYTAFGCPDHYLTEGMYQYMNSTLHGYGIKITAVAVLYKELNETFVSFLRNFSSWCTRMHFDNIRIRSNFYKKDDFFTRYLNDNTFGGKIIRAEGLNSKMINVNGQDVLLLQGVPSLVGHVVGVEAVVDDNGLPYIDYGKEHPFEKRYIDHVYVNNRTQNVN